MSTIKSARERRKLQQVALFVDCALREVLAGKRVQTTGIAGDGSVFACPHQEQQLRGGNVSGRLLIACSRFLAIQACTDVDADGGRDLSVCKGACQLGQQYRRQVIYAVKTPCLPARAGVRISPTLNGH